jgi:hypothetical protein
MPLVLVNRRRQTGFSRADSGLASADACVKSEARHRQGPVIQGSTNFVDWVDLQTNTNAWKYPLRVYRLRSVD